MPVDSTFEQILHDHQTMVFRTLARLLGRSDCLEDLAQEVFLRLYRALPSFRGESLISTYLYRITVNVAQNEWKRLQREDRRHISLSAPGPGDSPSWEDRLRHPDPSAADMLETGEFALLVDHYLQQLSLIERTILVLYHQEERTYEQIALALALPIGTVRTHLHRGRKKLKQALTQPKPATEDK